MEIERIDTYEKTRKKGNKGKNKGENDEHM